MFSSLVERNGFDIMNYAVETLKNMTVSMDCGKNRELKEESEREHHQSKLFSRVPETMTEDRAKDPLKRSRKDLKIIITSHKIELSVPPQAVINAVEEILECVVCAGRHVWNQVKDFFGWIWNKLSNLLQRKTRVPPRTK